MSSRIIEALSRSLLPNDPPRFVQPITKLTATAKRITAKTKASGVLKVVVIKPTVLDAAAEKMSLKPKLIFNGVYVYFVFLLF